MKLPFDENLSPELPGLLARLFPLSAHVRDLGLVGADDSILWNAAVQQGFALATKDDDFVELSILGGAPPKVVLIGIGNCRTSAIVALLESERLKIERFAQDEFASLLELP